MKLFSQDEAWNALIDWIAAEHLPFTTVKSPFFLQFVRMLQPRFNGYSDVTVERIRSLLGKMIENGYTASCM